MFVRMAPMLGRLASQRTSQMRGDAALATRPILCCHSGMAKNPTRHGDPLGCPHPDCSGGRAGMQRPLTDGELKEIPKAQRGNYYICGYCSCVYERGAQVRIVGWLTGKGWEKNR
jgi:hypothetical protein